MIEIVEKMSKEELEAGIKQLLKEGKITLDDIAGNFRSTEREYEQLATFLHTMLCKKAHAPGHCHFYDEQKLVATEKRPFIEEWTRFAKAMCTLLSASPSEIRGALAWETEAYRRISSENDYLHKALFTFRLINSADDATYPVELDRYVHLLNKGPLDETP